MKKIRTLLIFLLFVLCPLTSYAEDCNDISNNTVWVDGLIRMKISLDKGAYEEALVAGREMFRICSQSPILNYYIAMALKGNGENLKSVEYLLKASEYAVEFKTPADTSKRIYYALYESEFPERTGEAVEELNLEIARLKSSNRSYASEMQINQEESENISQSAQESQLSDLRAAMWTGAGIGLTGVVLTAVGGALAFKDADHVDASASNFKANPSDISVSATVKPLHTAALVMFGAGAALTVAGAVVTGIFGYKYTHFDSEKYSFSVTPEQVSFGMTF